LPENFVGDLQLGHKMKKFFQLPKHATSDPMYHVNSAAEMTNSATMTLSTTTMAGIMLTFCIQYKSSKLPMTYTWDNDLGPHMDSIFRRCDFMWSDLCTSVYGNNNNHHWE